MSIHLTGEKTRVVEKIQKRIDRFTESSQAFESAKKAVEDWTAKNVALGEVPHHEAHLQTLFSNLQQAANNLKTAADRIREKTDSKHIDKYFHKRYSIFKSYYTYISTGFKSTFKALNKTTTQILATNYDAAVDQLRGASQRRTLDAQASIEYSLIDQTFPSCQERLLMENPPEYLRQSLLYQNKLLDNKDAAGAIAFGTAWVKNIPKEATWDQIEHASCVLLEAAKASDHADLAEYRAGLEQWIKEHSPANPESEPMTPDKAASPEGRRNLVLGMLYFSEGLNTPEAFQVYQNCSALLPGQHAWKVAQAHYHISQHQGPEAQQLLASLPQDDPLVIEAQKVLGQAELAWKIEEVYVQASNPEHLIEAKKLLDDLPQDHPSALEAQRQLAQIHHTWNVARQIHQGYQHLYNLEWVEAKQALAGLPQDDQAVKEARETIDDSLRDRISSALLDVSPIAFSWLIPLFRQEGRAADMAQTGLQLISNPSLRRKWVPLLLTTSRSVIPPSPSNSWIPLGGDLVDCLFRNTKYLKSFQKGEKLISSIVRTVNLAWGFRANPKERSLLSLMNLGSSFASAGQTFDEWREIHRAPSCQAMTCTFQKVTSEIGTACTIASISDLAPLMGFRPDQLTQKLGIRQFTAKVLPGSSDIAIKEKWFFAALGIAAIMSKSVYQYPYEWASRVMKEAETYYAQEKYEDVKQVFAESENTYFVSRSRVAVQAYAQYLTWLIDNSQFWKDSVYPNFVKRLEGALIALAGNSYYASTRNHLLLKKLEAAIMKQDLMMLQEVLDENPDDQVVNYGFNFLITYALYLAHFDRPRACCLVEWAAPFPQRFHPAKNVLIKLLERMAKFNFMDLLQKPPAPEDAQQCNTAITELQDYLSKQNEKTGVYQDLQYYKLLISLAEPSNTERTEALFKECDPKLHERLTSQLILLATVLWRGGDHKSAIALLKRVQFNFFKDNEFIQNYCQSLSLLDTPKTSLEFKAIDIESLKAEFRPFFSACRIIFTLDAGKTDEAKKLLDQELPDSAVPAEVAALLFVRIHVAFPKNGNEKTLTSLKEIEKLGSWQHQGLFKAFQDYLLSENAPESRLQRISTMIQQLKAAQLTHLADHWQSNEDVLKFYLCLMQNKFQEANALLQANSKELCTPLFLFLLNNTEQLRQHHSLANAKETLEQMINYFVLADLKMFNVYLDFLVCIEKIQQTKDLEAHQKACQSLDVLIKQLASIDANIPETLEYERANILSKIVFIAKISGQPQTASKAFETMKQLRSQNEEVNRYIQTLMERLT